MNGLKDYFLIGDFHTSALVSKCGSIDWLCFPHFDSPSVFAKILDKKAGEFSVIAKGYKNKAKYMKNTAIVENIFFKNNKENLFVLKDFMVPQTKSKIGKNVLVRKISSLSGDHIIKFKFSPKPNYARANSKIIYKNNLLITLFKGKKLILHIPENSIVKKDKDEFIISFNLREGEVKRFILEYCNKKNDYDRLDLESKTKFFWENWISKGNFFDFCREKLKRSAITLKLLQFSPTGAIIASPTTSLPEAIGGNRNWDYRYVWIRDATFTLYALHILGYKEEAEKFFKFIESISRECEKCNINVEIFYTINGKKPPKEKILENLSGYKNSKPVRIGNGVTEQFQLDVYGVLIDSYYFALSRDVPILKSSKDIILDLVDKIIKKWKEKDNGIWEFRENIENYTYSKVMAWVGVDRAIKICDLLKIPKEKN